MVRRLRAAGRLGARPGARTSGGLTLRTGGVANPLQASPLPLATLGRGFPIADFLRGLERPEGHPSGSPRGR